MGSHNEKSESEKVLPEGFIFVNFNTLLYAIAMSVICGFTVAGAGTLGGILLLVFTLVLGLAGIVSRRKSRMFLKENGELEITFTFSPEPDKNVKKQVIFRNVGEIMDDCIDKVLDKIEVKKTDKQS